MLTSFPLWQYAGGSGSGTYSCVTFTVGGATPLWTYPTSSSGSSYWFEEQAINPNPVAVELQAVSFSNPLIYGYTPHILPALSTTTVKWYFDPAIYGTAAITKTNGGAIYVGTTKVCEFDTEFDAS